MKQIILLISWGISAEEFHITLILEVCALVVALCSGFGGCYPAVESIVEYACWHL